MTDQEKNRKIAEWLGWELDESDPLWPIWTHTKYGYLGGSQPGKLDYCNTNASFDLLDVLAGKDYMFRLYYTAWHKYDFTIWICNELGQAIDSVVVEDYEDKSRAIVEAILALIEKEKSYER